MLRGTSFAFLAAVTSATTARADDGDEPLRIVDFRVPVECPSSAQFVENVASRSGRVRAAKPDELARSAAVSITRSGSEYAGELSMSLARTSLRMEARGTCEAVLDVFAHSIAFSLDPEAHPPREGFVLPDNPYWVLLSRMPPETVLPENPYPAILRTMAPSLPDNPYRRPRRTIARRDGPPLPDNPYRTE